MTFSRGKAQVEASSQWPTSQDTKAYDAQYSDQFPEEVTGLHLAAYFGVEAVSKVLLENGAVATAADGEGQTPLHWASVNGHVEVVKAACLKRGPIQRRLIHGDRRHCSWPQSMGTSRSSSCCSRRGQIYSGG